MEWLDPQELVLGWGWILLDAESLVTQKWKHEAEGENSLIRPPMSYRVPGMGTGDMESQQPDVHHSSYDPDLFALGTNVPLPGASVFLTVRQW